jgi:hypothetical protein
MLHHSFTNHRKTYLKIHGLLHSNYRQILHPYILRSHSSVDIICWRILSIIICCCVTLPLSSKNWQAILLVPLIRLRINTKHMSWLLSGKCWCHFPSKSDNMVIIKFTILLITYLYYGNP